MPQFNIKQNTAAVSGVISDQVNGAAVLQTIYGENWEGAECFFMIFAPGVLPVGGETPQYSWRIPEDGGFNANLPGQSPQAPIGERFATGVAVGWSTTDETYTPAAVGGKWWATGRSGT